MRVSVRKAAKGCAGLGYEFDFSLRSDTARLPLVDGRNNLHSNRLRYLGTLSRPQQPHKRLTALCAQIPGPNRAAPGDRTRGLNRLIVGKPPYKQPLHRFNQVGSTTAHLLLYGLMILMPVTGYVFTGAGGHPLPFYGLFEWPSVVPKDKALSQLAGTFHYWGAWAICSVLIVHILAVVWHSLAKRDEVFGRMLPTTSKPSLRYPSTETLN